jgi:hypothetical protein
MEDCGLVLASARSFQPMTRTLPAATSPLLQLVFGAAGVKPLRQHLQDEGFALPIASSGQPEDADFVAFIDGVYVGVLTARGEDDTPVPPFPIGARMDVTSTQSEVRAATTTTRHSAGRSARD